MFSVYFNFGHVFFWVIMLCLHPRMHGAAVPVSMHSSSCDSFFLWERNQHILFLQISKMEQHHIDASMLYDVFILCMFVCIYFTYTQIMCMVLFLWEEWNECQWFRDTNMQVCTHMHIYGAHNFNIHNTNNMTDYSFIIIRLCYGTRSTSLGYLYACNFSPLIIIKRHFNA